MGIHTAHEAGHTGEGATIALLDTEVEIENAYLPTPVATKDFTDQGESVDLTRRSPRGTRLAGLMAGASHHPEYALSTIAPDADIAYGQVVYTRGPGDENVAGPIADGIRWAVDEVGADVIHLGDPRWDEDDDRADDAHDAIRYAFDQGVSVFTPESDAPPATQPEANVVAPLDRDFSIIGSADNADFAAPGVDLPGIDWGDAYTIVEGDAYATAMVAGAAAIMVSSGVDSGSATLAFRTEYHDAGYQTIDVGASVTDPEDPPFGGTDPQPTGTEPTPTADPPRTTPTRDTPTDTPSSPTPTATPEPAAPLPETQMSSPTTTETVEQQSSPWWWPFGGWWPFSSGFGR